MGANVSVGLSLSFYLPRLLDLYYTLNIQRSFIFVFLCRFLSVEGNFIHRLLSGHRGGSATTLKKRGAATKKLEEQPTKIEEPWPIEEYQRNSFLHFVLYKVKHKENYIYRISNVPSLTAKKKR